MTKYLHYLKFYKNIKVILYYVCIYMYIRTHPQQAASKIAIQNASVSEAFK